MSWTDKELDELARKAEANQTFAYDDSFWTEMEAALPAQKKRKWPVFLLALFPIIGVLAFYEVADSSLSDVSNGAKKMKFVSTASSRNSSSADNNSGNANTANLSSMVAASSNFSNLSARKTEIGNSPFLPVEQRNISAHQFSASNENEEQKTAVARDKSTNYLLVTKSENSNRNSGVRPIENEENEARNSLTEGLIKPLFTDESTMKTEEEQVGIGELSTAVISVFSFESATNLANLKYRPVRPFYSLFTEIGLGMGETYAAGQIGHTKAANLSAGARYTNKHFFVQAGLGMEWEKVTLELCERSKVYKTSCTTYENRFSYKEMFRILVPLSVGYSLGNHVVQMGVTPTYLLGTKLNYSYLENDNLKRDELRFGTTEGWKKFGLKTNIGYGYNVFPSTTIGANFQIQLINQLEKNWISNINQYPISGQLFVRRTIR
jgi:hypothetical protein